MVNKALGMVLRRSLQALAAAALLALYSSQPALAADLLIQNFDTLSNCATGREETCWTDNGFTAGHQTTFVSGTIKSDGGAQGDGYFRVQMPDGATSTGRITIDITDSPNVTWGKFVRFSNNYMFYSQTHGPGVRISGDSGCDMGGNWEPSNKPDYYLAEAGSCGITGANHRAGTAQSGMGTFKGGRWYWVVQRLSVDTSCTDSSSFTGCNGVYEMWVDGTKWLEQTNINMAGVLQNAEASVFAWENYFHNGWVSLNDQPQYIDFDSLIITDGTTYIDVPEGVTQGTASDTNYFIGCYKSNGVARQHNDCLTSGPFVTRGGTCAFGGSFGNTAYTGEGTSSPVGNDGYPPDATACSSQAVATDKYLKFSVDAGQQAGIALGRDDYGEFRNGAGGTAWYQYWCAHGHIWLSSDNTYTTNPLMVGWRADKNGNDQRALALTVDEVGGTNRWAIGHRWGNGSATTAVLGTSSTDIIEDEWVEFQLCQDATNETVSLNIEGTYVINNLDISAVSADIMQDPGDDGGASVVIGVIRNTESSTLDVYYDDYNVGTASFIDSRGWADGDSPFDPDPEPEPEPTGDTAGPFVGAIF